MPVAFRLLMKRSVVAAFLILAFVLQGTTSVLAGTTGSISGTVIDASTNQPIAGAKVTALSPSQSVTTTTGPDGRYTFLSLSPDTYTITVAAGSKYEQSSLSGISVLADANNARP